jgi:hypothetical protein
MNSSYLIVCTHCEEYNKEKTFWRRRHDYSTAITHISWSMGSHYLCITDSGKQKNEKDEERSNIKQTKTNG